MKVTPILRLALPLIIGMSGAFVFHEYLSTDNIILISLIVFALLAAISLFFLSNHKISFIPYFSLSAYLFFLLFGVIIALSSIEKAKERYDNRWRFSVYTNNTFRIAIADSTQQSIHHWMVSKGIKGEAGAVIEAMTLGIKSGISKENKAHFNKAGVSHILALSGFHVGIIYMILQFVFFAHITSHKICKLSSLFIITLLWIYSFIAGMSPSLVRAVIMCSILTINTYYIHQPLSLNALAISALIILIANPLMLIHTGFQLSYLSMLGIYFIGLPIIKFYNGYTIIDRALWVTLIVTLSCSIFTLPIVSYTFGQIPLLSFFSNIIVTFLTYTLFLVLAVWLLTGGWSLITPFLLGISSYLIHVVTNISNLSFSVASIRVTIPYVILYYCILGIALILIHRYHVLRQK